MSKANDEHITYVDTYGFKIPEEESKRRLEEIHTEEHKVKIRKENERVKKWLFMLEHEQQFFHGNRKSKLKARIRKGIPNAVRGRVWKRLVGVDEAMKANPKYYHQLLEKTPGEPWKSTIDKDLDRTFPNHCLFYDVKFLGFDNFFCF
ncbi:TBC domain containing protein, partial [Reticulomyxa filosa]